MDSYWIHDPATPGLLTAPANWSNGQPSGTGSTVGIINNGGTAEFFTGSTNILNFGRIGDTGSGAVVQHGGESSFRTLHLGFAEGSS